MEGWLGHSKTIRISRSFSAFILLAGLEEGRGTHSSYRGEPWLVCICEQGE